MRFRLVGATDGHVTGSCTHFVYERKKIEFLVDCGMVQGEGDMVNSNAKPFPFTPQKINFVLLTHAHLDHCGLIPKLYKEGFKGRVICTTATAKLVKISLKDSLRFVGNLYSEKDVESIQFDCIDQRSTFGFSRFLPIDDDLFASFCRTSHILGSVSITLSWINNQDQRRSLVLSGDLGNNTKDNQYQPLLAGRQGIYGYPDAILVESTYGGKNRDQIYSDYETRLSTLKNHIQDVVFDRKEILLIPAFAMHRTQELLIDIYTVLRRFFSDETSCKSPIFSSQQLENHLQKGRWDHLIQHNLEKAISLLPDEEKKLWEDSIVLTKNQDLEFFEFRENSTLTVDDLRKFLSRKERTYGVDVILDSSLAAANSGVYRDELVRRQHKSPEETLYRNRNMPERLGLSSEIEVDNFLKTIFPDSNVDDSSFTFGQHKIQFHHKKNFKLPRRSNMQERGCIVITGGGMCDGGPVVSHLSNILENNREAAILSTGYLATGSLGHTLFKQGMTKNALPNIGQSTITIEEKQYTLTDKYLRFLECNNFYSGHADQNGILNFVFEVVGKDNESLTPQPTTIFLNHGQHAPRNALKQAIENRAELSTAGDRTIESVELTRDANHWYDIETKTWVVPAKEGRLTQLLSEILTEQRRTNVFLERLLEKRFTQKINTNVKKNRNQT